MKNLLKQILKKVLPQPVKNFGKVIISKYPYLWHPTYLFNRAEYTRELNQILEEGSYKGIIIYPPTIDWHMPLFQRPQQLAMAFARLGYLFFYCTNNLRYDKVKSFEKIEENLFVTSQAHLLGAIKEPNLFISWPFNRFYVHRFQNPHVIYDYIDELDVFDARGKSKKELFDDHKWLVQNADLVVATADKLLTDVKELEPKKAILVPNGVNLAHFQTQTKAVPDDLKKIKETGKPIIGYYGAIAEWFDYGLLEKAAKDRPDYEFVMIGPYDYDKTLMKNKHLFEIGNIHFLGPKKYSELPSYLHYFDVATIPFVVNAITRATSPVKLFEYMAGGKPIVTSAMDECKKYKSVLVYEDAKDFDNKIDEALKKSKDADYLALLKKEAEENTWTKRAEAIIGGTK